MQTGNENLSESWKSQDSKKVSDSAYQSWKSKRKK